MQPYPPQSHQHVRLSEIEHEVMNMKAQYALQQQDVATRMLAAPGTMAVSQTSFMQQAGPTPEHQDLMKFNNNLMGMYTNLMKKHVDLLDQHKNVVASSVAKIKATAGAGGGGGGGANSGLAKAVSLGVIRLDYDYPPAPGDIDCPQSFGYDVFYRVVPGLTFEMCQSGTTTTTAITTTTSITTTTPITTT